MKKNYYRPPYTIISAIILSITMIIGLSGCGNDSGTGPNSNRTIAEVMQQDSTLSSFNQILIDAGVQSKFKANGSFTIFAPTNDALNKLPDGFLDTASASQLNKILNYHVLNQALRAGDLRDLMSLETSGGDSIFVDSGSEIELNHRATVSNDNIQASNGDVYKVDHLLLPDSFLNVFQVIHKRYRLGKFACHCTSGRTNLDNVLSNEDAEFTVFAPTDQAFDNMDMNVDNISDAKLKTILNYHIIDQSITSNQLTDGQTLTTRNGSTITISKNQNGKISINSGAATVEQADIKGKNGTVYIINSVLLPPANS